MPNIITHVIFAYKVKSKLEDILVKEAISNFKQEFTIGSNGPDFLFFYDACPWILHPDKSVSMLGGEIHSKKINDFYNKAIEIVKNEKDPVIKQAMLSYLAGHLCHWALDKTTHPYIFYFTGNGSQISQIYHHRFESMLDTIVLKKFTNKSIKDFKYSKLCSQGEVTIDAISNYYVEIAQSVYGYTLTKEMIQKSLKDWKRIQNYLYDSTGLKKKILLRIEKEINLTGIVSENIVPYKIDESYDILNERRETWKYPAIPSIISNQTFMELFDEAIHLAVKAIQLLNDIIKGNMPDYALAYLLKNQSYDTGVSGKKEMSEFKIIYETRHDNETI